MNKENEFYEQTIERWKSMYRLNQSLAIELEQLYTQHKKYTERYLSIITKLERLKDESEE